MRKRYYYKDSNWKRFRMWYKGLGHGGCSCWDDRRREGKGEDGSHYLHCRLITAKIWGK